MPELPEIMRAIVATRPGGPEVLELQARPRPNPSAGEILVKVEAAGVNRPDVLQRQGRYQPPPGASDVLGLEAAGEVVALGPGASRHALGARVAALVPGGGYAEYCVAHERQRAADLRRPIRGRGGGHSGNLLHRLDQRLRARRAEGGRDAAGARGTLRDRHHRHSARQGVRRARVATAGSDEKVRACVALGADLAINYRTEDFVLATLAATDGKGADVILDMVGGDYVARNHAAAALDGRIVQIAFLRGQKAEIDLHVVMAKRLYHTGSTLRPRSAAEKAVIAEALHAKVWPLLAKRGAASRSSIRAFRVDRGGRRASAHREPGARRQDRADGLKGPMPRYKLTIEYAGTELQSGWQR